MRAFKTVSCPHDVSVTLIFIHPFRPHTTIQMASKEEIAADIAAHTDSDTPPNVHGKNLEKSTSEEHGVRDDVSEEAQAGVRAVQAATSVWSKWHLVAAYGLYDPLFKSILMSDLH